MLRVMGLSKFQPPCQWRRIKDFDATIVAKSDNFYGFHILHVFVNYIDIIPCTIFETGCTAWSCCSCIPYRAAVALCFALFLDSEMRLYSPLYGVAQSVAHKQSVI
jgi:hypothetical protein